MNNESKINAVGIWFYSKSTARHLYLMRNDVKYKGHWSLPGGKVEEGETLLSAIERECTEEMGFMPEAIKLIPIEKFTATGDFFSYHTFYCIVEEEFIPVLNHEHVAYAWIDSDIIPKPLHPGLWATLKIEDIFTRINTLKDLYIK
jgi:ADP-ribose pyrophosphatase YjhB (NUDIX family)